MPRRKRGRQTPEAEDRYLCELREFAEAILEIDSTLDFKVSSRGWCYILENESGLVKSDFDKAQLKINECRKAGLLPMDICATDEAREFSCLEEIGAEPKEEAGRLIQRVLATIKDYSPVSFWQGQEYYLQMLVEKIDLRTLFESICQKYYIPIANTKGWSDLNQRYDMMRRFKYWQSQDKQCVLLYCGDFDPDGKLISDTLMKNMVDVMGAVDWSPASVQIDRFGLNEDFINRFSLSWIDGLITGGGKDLADPGHKRHYADYIQDWLKRYGARKVESNALVVRPKEGRKLCEKAIRQYVRASAPNKFQTQIEPYREKLLNQFKKRFGV
ncbi:hypothetical protein ES703_13121 [subsurface metagenome]